MSVLIRGMKMPEDCPVCPLAHWNKLDRFTGCELIKRYFDKEDMETRGRPSFCPLVELKPHGRLIDADALMEEFLETYTEYERKKLLVFYAAEVKQEVADMITDAPTIIPAEEGK